MPKWPRPKAGPDINGGEHLYHWYELPLHVRVPEDYGEEPPPPSPTEHTWVSTSGSSLRVVDANQLVSTNHNC